MKSTIKTITSHRIPILSWGLMRLLVPFLCLATSPKDRSGSKPNFQLKQASEPSKSRKQAHKTQEFIPLRCTYVLIVEVTTKVQTLFHLSSSPKWPQRSSSNNPLNQQGNIQTYQCSPHKLPAIVEAPRVTNANHTESMRNLSAQGWILPFPSLHSISHQILLGSQRGSGVESSERSSL
jgi:hypothetical protein